MLFNSLQFLAFFPTICLVYFCIPQAWLRLRNLFLLAASYVFYMGWQPAYALWLLGGTLVTYLSALAIESSHRPRLRLTALCVGILLNGGALFLFKYYDFVAGMLTTALQSCTGADVFPSFPTLGWLLPVGISFYTFQALGYCVDVYRGRTRAERDFFTYALFVAFFPQLVAGPIERSTHLLPQFRRVHRFDADRLLTGLRLMAWGYFLKLVLADRCGVYVDIIWNNMDYHNGGSYLLAGLLFPFQVYGDFAGYSFIAVGAARVMGFRLMQNFRRPYFSSSVGEFWHRWHCSLSTWLRDYVYIPLGGSRHGQRRTLRNLLLTFVLSGLWHGAGWTFILWGCLHGVLLCGERVMGVRGRPAAGPVRAGRVMLTFVLVSVAWVLFRAPSLSDAFSLLYGIFAHPGIPYHELGTFIAIALALVLLFCQELQRETGYRRQYLPRWLSSCLSVSFLSAYTLLCGVLSSNQFIYFQF